YLGRCATADLALTAVVALAAVAVRFGCHLGASRMSFLSSRPVKRTLRQTIYEKLLRLGAAYRDQVRSSEVVQVAVEGVDQLETYFGSYLPQFFYAMLAPLTLFVVLCFVDLPAALVLLVCVPLIPIAIAAAQTWAKKLLSRYWTQYTALGDTFLENLQGLTTLKIYGADGFKNKEMNEQSEQFRRITMKVLTMQLNSITIMDLVAYGGAAAGMIVALSRFRSGTVGLAMLFASVLLCLRGAVDFAGVVLSTVALMSSFGPVVALANLGSTLQNTFAAGNRVLDLLEEPPAVQDVTGREEVPFTGAQVSHVTFSYGEETILEDLSLAIPEGSITGIVGRSGSGKSTLLKLLMRFWQTRQGSITISDRPIDEINTQNLRGMESYVTQETVLFHDSIRSNLRIAKRDATDAEIEQACRKASVHDFIMSLPQGYDTPVGELGDTLSGGERQRLGLARAFLHDAPLMLLDEPTSNLDSLNEAVILRSLREERQGKTVVLVSHRASTMWVADTVWSVENGRMS
ncbi:MAG: ATP-binding cassette domain-containing protein, partial [Gemmiger sp.]